METKIIPFDLKTAKKIQEGEIEGKIITKNKIPCRIVAYCNSGDIFIQRATLESHCDWCYPYTRKGCYIDGHLNGGTDYDLVLEVPDTEPQKPQFNLPYNIEQLSKLKDYVKQIIDVNQSTIGILQNLRKDLKHICDTNKSSNFNSKTLFDNWDVIQNSLNKLFKDNALKNNVKISNSDLIHYASEFFTWLRETHLIFNFQCDKLEELNQYAKEHIMDPSWSDEARRDIKQIFGIDTQNREFKPYDKVLVRNTNTNWMPAYFAQKCSTGFRVIGGELFAYCIPYEGNEHLIGTTDKQ